MTEKPILNGVSLSRLDTQKREKAKLVRKKCLGCCDTFTCSQSKNYDYCFNCSLNNSRYLNKDTPCSECDGSGIIQFPKQPVRNCKSCYLARQEQREENIFAKYA